MLKPSPMPKPKESRHYSILLLHDADRRFLLQLRPKEEEFLPHHWCFFGGRVNPGETPVQSLKRNSLSKLNHRSIHPRFVMQSHSAHDAFDACLYVFVEPKPVVFSDLKLNDGVNWCWVRADELETLRMLPVDRDIVNYADKWIQAGPERHASVVIPYDSNGRFLLQHREENHRRFGGKWAFFGGGVEPGETPLQAAKREMMEELEYPIKKPELVMETTFQHDNSRSVLHVFAVPYHNEPLTIHEGQGMGWYAPEDLHALDMLRHDRDIFSYVHHWLETKRSS